MGPTHGPGSVAAVPLAILSGEELDINISMSAHKIPIELRFPLDLGDIRLNQATFERSYQADPESGCWLWHGGRHRQGYGMMGAWDTQRNCRRMVTAHRASWRIHRGVTGTQNVMHTCMNFHCVNPDHLALGSQSETISKPSRNRVGWPPGRPKLSLRGRQLGRRTSWNYKYSDIEIQFLRTAPFSLIRDRWPTTPVERLRAIRARARLGYHWLPWPRGTEHLRPPALSAKVVVDAEN